MAPLSNAPDGLTSFGIPLLGGEGIMTPGTSYFLDPKNGSDSYDGKGIHTAFKSLATAYDALTDNNNDVLYYIGGSTALTIPGAITWAKSYTHFIGIGVAPTFMAQRTRIFHSANFSPMFTVSGSGCIFKNFYMSYGNNGADNHILWTATGDRNYYGNVHFACMNHQTEADDASSVGLYLNGSSENLFSHCTLGNDTIERGAANATLSFAGASARNKFDGCLFEMFTDASTPVHIKVSATGIDRFAWFNDCVFHSHGTTITQAIDSNITDSTNRQIWLTGNTVVIGATDVADATGDGSIWFRPDTATANVALIGTNIAVN